MKLASIRFAGEIQFPGVARNSPTFNERDGFEITTDGMYWVRVAKEQEAILIPWTRVLEANTRESGPLYLEVLIALVFDMVKFIRDRFASTEPLPAQDPPTRDAPCLPLSPPAAVAPNDYTFRNPTADETAPQPARRGRRGRRQAPPE